MINKYLNIFVVLIFLSSLVIIPNLQYSMASEVSKKNTDISKNFYVNTEKRDEIEQLFKHIIDDLSLGTNPNEKFCRLLRYREIKETIRTISDNETLEIIESFFSRTPNLLKIVKLSRYTKKIETQNHSETFNKFKNEINIFITQNYSSMENTPMLPKISMSPIEIQKWNSEVEKYLNHNPKMQNIINVTAIDPILFILSFAISILFWGFIYGAAACCMPHILSLGICVAEATIVSVGFGLIIETMYYSDIPILQQIIDYICTMFSITKEQLLTVIISLTCVVVFSLFIWIWNICPFGILKIPLKAIGGGMMLVGPPLLFAFLVSNIH